jgi:hypothetical protein
MFLDRAAAQRFIHGYSLIMLEVLGGSSRRYTGNLVPWLAKGRAKLMKKPELLQKAKASLEARSIGPDPDVLLALEGLDVRQWVYLRDTKVHSIFIDPSTDRAFGVLGLTQPIRDIIGRSGAVMETGLVRYRGRIVCDGVVSGAVWLGPSYKKSFGEKFQALKAEGRFYVKVDA